MPGYFLGSRKLKGFSMGEVILASFVLTTGLLSVMALISQSYIQAIEGKNVIVASELAQEGVELMRNVRDNSVADGNGAFDGFPAAVLSECRMSYDDAAPSCLPLSMDNQLDRYILVYDSGTGTYKHGAPGNSQGRFSRFIYLSHAVGADNATVRSFAYWGEAPAEMHLGNTGNCIQANKCVYTEIILTNWGE